MDQQPQALQQATQQAGAQPPNPQDLLQAANDAMLKKKKDLASADQNQAAISQALAMINPNGKDTATRIGNSIATPNYAGYCLKWVDDQQGNQNRLPTAYADYQAHAQAGDISTATKIPAGARVYFSPDSSNGNMGHVGIAGENNTFTSATDNGVKTYSINDWQKLTGQSLLGWTKSK